MPPSSSGERPQLPLAKPIATELLDLDPQNPRIRELSPTTAQREILDILWRDFAVDEVALSIATNGFFEHEPLFAEEHEGRFTVIEGNRRLAAVRILTDDEMRARIGNADLRQLSASEKEDLQDLPVIVCKRQDVWQYLGFKHVNGPAAWHSLAKAEYIAWVHNTTGVPLEVIAERIGDKHSTVRRFYRALMALRQAEESGTFDRNDRWKSHFSFSHLYTGLDYAGIQAFTGVKGETSYREKPVPARRLEQFGELCEWLYGSKSKSRPNVVQSQNPDLRILDEVLKDKDGVAALRKGLPLRTSRDISRGDKQLFREALVSAKQSLQDARGRVIPGYQGESDLLDTANDVRSLANSLHAEVLKISRGGGAAP